MDFNELTDEQKKKMLSANTSEELLALIESEGIELTDEELESVSGGKIWGNDSSNDSGLGIQCPECGSKDVRVEYWVEGCDQCVLRCYSCHHGWLGLLPD